VEVSCLFDCCVDGYVKNEYVTEFVWDIFYVLDIYKIRENTVYDSVQCESLSKREFEFIINFFHCLNCLRAFTRWVISLNSHSPSAEEEVTTTWEHGFPSKVLGLY
jgi:hypothetical protein